MPRQQLKQRLRREQVMRVFQEEEEEEVVNPVKIIRHPSRHRNCHREHQQYQQYQQRE